MTKIYIAVRIKKIAERFSSFKHPLRGCINISRAPRLTHVHLSLMRFEQRYCKALQNNGDR